MCSFGQTSLKQKLSGKCTFNDIFLATPKGLQIKLVFCHSHICLTALSFLKADVFSKFLSSEKRFNLFNLLSKLISLACRSFSENTSRYFNSSHS
jgi:hypothetical protein